MAQNLDLLLTIFPFEAACFANTKLPVAYVGHPLVTAIPKQQKSPSKTLALFPGSRTTEVQRNLPIQMRVAKKLKQQNPDLDIAISSAHPQVQALAKGFPCRFVPPESTYALMREAHLALATSGTVTLELALHETPTLVNFAIRPCDLFLAQKIFRIHLPFYCIVNIIASKEIFPEFFGPNLTEDALYSAAQKLWNDASKRALCQKSCLDMRHLLEQKDLMQNGASLILD